jgi:uncharacterized protein
MSEDDASHRSFLGRGFGFPVAASGSGSMVMVRDEEDIRQAMLLILETEKGERLMRPDFGVGLRRLMFRPLNTATKALVQKEITDALVEWEPRIDVESVIAREDRAREGVLLVSIRYAVRATNTFYNLVFPFYMKEQR